MVKTLGVKGASIYFWVALFMVFAATMLALSGIAQSQYICDTEGFAGVLTYFHAALQAALKGKHGDDGSGEGGIVAFKCSSFQNPQWWTFASQMWYMIAAMGVVLMKKLPQYKVAVIAAGCIATAQCVTLCWNAIELGGGIYGTLGAAGLRTFWAFFACCAANPCLMFALCDLDWALKLRRKQEKAQALQCPAPRAQSSSQSSLKRSSSDVMLDV